MKNGNRGPAELLKGDRPAGVAAGPWRSRLFRSGARNAKRVTIPARNVSEGQEKKTLVRPRPRSRRVRCRRAISSLCMFAQMRAASLACVMRYQVFFISFFRIGSGQHVARALVAVGRNVQYG